MAAIVVSRETCWPTSMRLIVISATPERRARPFWDSRFPVSGSMHRARALAMALPKVGGMRP